MNFQAQHQAITTSCLNTARLTVNLGTITLNFAQVRCTHLIISAGQGLAVRLFRSVLTAQQVSARVLLRSKFRTRQLAAKPLIIRLKQDITPTLTQEIKANLMKARVMLKSITNLLTTDMATRFWLTERQVITIS